MAKYRAIKKFLLLCSIKCLQKKSQKANLKIVPILCDFLLKIFSDLSTHLF